MKANKKLLKAANMERNLKFLAELGYEAKQMKCPWQYKDRNLLFYPTTGTYFDEYTRLKGKIASLPSRNTLLSETRPVIGQYGKEHMRPVWLFNEFAHPKSMLPDDETVFERLLLL